MPQPDEVGKELVKRFEEIDHKRLTFASSWQEIADHMIGRRDFINKETPGRKRMRQIYDSVGLQSGTMLQSNIQSLLYTRESRRFSLKFSDPNLHENDEAMLWLEDFEEQMFMAFNRPEGNFSPQLGEAIFDIIFFGTGAQYVEEDATGLPMWSARPLGEMYLAENAQGKIDTVYTKRPLTNRQAVAEWGEAAVPRAAQAMKSGHEEDTRDYLHCVRPMRPTDRLPYPASAQGFRWYSAHVDLEDKRVLSSGGYRVSPYAIGRWSKDAGEVYGRSPGWIALSDQKMLNAMMKNTIEAATLRVNPPLQYDSDSVIGQVRWEPRSLIATRDLTGSGKPPITPLDTGGDPGIGIQIINRVEENIRSAFFWQLLALTPNIAGVTATAVADNRQKAQQFLAPVLDGLQHGMMDSNVDIVADMLLGNGYALPPPPILEGQRIEVEYLSPVTRAAKQSEVDAILLTAQDAINLSQSDPDVLIAFDMPESMRHIAENRRVPPSLLRTREEVESIKEAQRQIAEEQAQAQELQQAADMVQKVTPAVQAVTQEQAQ